MKISYRILIRPTLLCPSLTSHMLNFCFFPCNWKSKSEKSDICSWAALTIKQINEVTGHVFVGSPFNWDETYAFLGMKGKACTKAQDYDYVIRIVQDRVPQDKSLKELGSEQWCANAEFPWE